MTNELGYSRDGDVVTVRISADDFAGLMLCLGEASTLYDPAHLALKIANAVNAGRPLSEWRPYVIPAPDSNDKRYSLQYCNAILDRNHGSKKELAKLAGVEPPFVTAVLRGSCSYNDRIHTFADRYVRKLLRKA
jgi:hypothetical protein